MPASPAARFGAKFGGLCGWWRLGASRVVSIAFGVSLLAGGSPDRLEFVYLFCPFRVVFYEWTLGG